MRVNDGIESESPKGVSLAFKRKLCPAEVHRHLAIHGVGIALESAEEESNDDDFFLLSPDDTPLESSSLFCCSGREFDGSPEADAGRCEKLIEPEMPSLVSLLMTPTGNSHTSRTIGFDLKMRPVNLTESRPPGKASAEGDNHRSALSGADVKSEDVPKRLMLPYF